MIMKDYKADEGLQGNDKIEKAIAGLQKETTQEMLAHTLTVIRRRMKDAGQLIIAVEPPSVVTVSFAWKQSEQKMVRTGGLHLPVLKRN